MVMEVPQLIQLIEQLLEYMRVLISNPAGCDKRLEKLFECLLSMKAKYLIRQIEIKHQPVRGSLTQHQKSLRIHDRSFHTERLPRA